MATITPVAFYTGGTISGTTQIGNLSVGTSDQDYGEVGSNNGITYWASPDQDNSYVIAHQDPSGGHNGLPGNVPAFVGFWKSDKNESAFIDLANYISLQDNDPQNFSTGAQAVTWLNSNGYWTSFPTAKRVLFLGDTNISTVVTNIANYITATGHSITYSAVTLDNSYDGSGGITTSNYDVVMMYTNGGNIGAAGLSTALQNYVNSGGNIVSGVFLWNIYPSGFNHSGLTAFDVTNSQSFSVGSFTVVTPTPITNGIGTLLPSSFSNGNPTLSSGASQLATFTNGVNCLAIKNVGSSTLISINAWPGNIVSSTSTITKMFGNSILYSTGVI